MLLLVYIYDLEFVLSCLLRQKVGLDRASLIDSISMLI